jgi:predicted Fe-Mo cluster-binding NifX family protein
MKVIKTILMQKVDVLLTARLGEISFCMHKDNLVDTYRVEEDQTIRDVVKRFQEKSLSSITRPTPSVDQSLVE